MKKIVFFGDSITDCNRDYNANNGTYEQLGTGYVREIATELFINYRDKYQCVNKGINGHRIDDLLNRVDQDVISLKPEIAMIMVGINDVWRHYDSHLSDMHQIGIEDFKSIYIDVVKKLQSASIEVMLSTCFFLELSLDNPMRQDVDAYNKVIREIAVEYHCDFFDAQSEMEQFFSEMGSYMISSDRVHLNHVGNTYLGKKLYGFIVNRLEGVHQND